MLEGVRATWLAGSVWESHPMCLVGFHPIVKGQLGLYYFLRKVSIANNLAYAGISFISRSGSHEQSRRSAIAGEIKHNPR